MKTPYYVAKLKSELSTRQRNNHGYSLRAFARDLSMHPSTLSAVIAGKRPIPRTDAQRVARVLKFGLKERETFLESIAYRKLSLDEIKISKAERESAFRLKEEQYQIIAEWEHYAVLNLARCEDFDSTYESIAQRLGITPLRAQIVVERLLEQTLLNRDAQGNLVRTNERLDTSEDITSPALQASHDEMMEIAKNKLAEVDLELRDFSSLTFAMEAEDVSDLKVLIREFKEKLNRYLVHRPKKEVFQLNLQLFPLTRVDLPKPELKKENDHENTL